MYWSSRPPGNGNTTAFPRASWRPSPKRQSGTQHFSLPPAPQPERSSPSHLAGSIPRTHAAIFRAEEEPGLFHARHDNDTVRLIKQILGYLYRQPGSYRSARRLKTSNLSSTLGFPVRRQRDGTHGAGNCQHGYQCFGHEQFSSSAFVRSNVTSNFLLPAQGPLRTEGCTSKRPTCHLVNRLHCGIQ
jgi:hypothetical protein